MRCPLGLVGEIADMIDVVTHNKKPFSMGLLFGGEEPQVMVPVTPLLRA
jgi:hypothetical protein